MYTPFQLAKKYLHYYFTASNGKGHGIHSPFVFEFVNNVLPSKNEAVYINIEKRRKELLNDDSIIEVEDFGAGSGIIKTKQRVVKKIAASSLKPKKYARLLHRIVQYYKLENIIELGTSFGITTSYLSCANENTKLYTFEGATSIANIAAATFTKLHRKNIELIKGDFAETLPSFLKNAPVPGLVFIDGNHRKVPTLQYFQEFLSISNEHSFFVFDDIHWSSEMEAAWEEIKQHEAVTLTIDLFFIGLVFFKTDFKVKQHFTIRF